MRTTIWYSSVVFITGTAAAALCILAEFRKSKKNDLRFDGKMCSLPQSAAFGLGVAALISLFTGQIAANFFVYHQLCSNRRHRRRKDMKNAVPYAFLSISWVVFVVAILLLTTAIGMSQSQPLGVSWVDRECYLVKSGVFSSSAFLGLLALGAVLGSAMTLKEVKPIAEESEPREPRETAVPNTKEHW